MSAAGISTSVGEDDEGGNTPEHAGQLKRFCRETNDRTSVHILCGMHGYIDKDDDPTCFPLLWDSDLS